MFRDDITGEAKRMNINFEDVKRMRKSEQALQR